MSTANEILEIAKSQINITELPPGSNKVKYNTWFYGKEVQGDAYPWCAAFVSWVFAQVDSSLIKKTASCSTMGDWFKEQNRFKTTNPLPGDVVFFKMKGGSSRWTNHVGIVLEVYPSYIVTIEGNTSFDEKGSQSNGGAVAKRKRALTSIVGYGSPKYTDTKKTLVKKNVNTGIDVSGYNPITDYAAVKRNGIDFAILKIIRKDLNEDKLFATHLNGIMKAGIELNGVYNYSYATNAIKAIVDAQKVVEVLSKYNLKTCVYLDVEDNCQKNLGHELIDIINSYQEIIENAGHKFKVYTGMSFFNSYIKKYASDLKCKEFWIARYYKGYTVMNLTDEIDESKKPNIDGIIGWQYTSSGVVNGIPGRVDLNVLYDNEFNGRVVNCNKLNIRDGGSITNRVIGVLVQNEKINVLEESNGWCKIVTKNGITGYCSAKYITF